MGSEVPRRGLPPVPLLLHQLQGGAHLHGQRGANSAWLHRTRAERVVLPSMPRQDGNPNLRSLQTSDRGEGGHRTWETLVRRAFVCAKCEKPFMGNRHYERKGLAYCETHYHQLFGNLCYVCNQVIQTDVFTALNKAWCVNHFACSSCDQKMTVKTKFYEVDLKPVCKKCYD